jgi:cellulose synthase operon protein C
MKQLRALLWVAVSIAAACTSDDPAALVASAKDYLAKRDFNASIIQLKNALQKDPQNAEARYLLGLASLENGDVVSADIQLQKAAELGWNTDEMAIALARAMLAKGAAGEVVAQFATKKLSSPELQAELAALVGAAQLDRNQRKEAETAIREALALDPGNVAANLGAARLAAVERKFGDALAKADKALARSPSSPQALLLKAELLATQGDSEAAEKGFRDAVGAAPSEVALRLRLVAHLVRYRQLEKAAAAVAELTAVAPKHPGSRYAEALVFFAQSRFPAAREALQQVLAVAPEDVPSLTLAGMAALQVGALPEAESHLRKALLKAPHALGAKRLLATTHLRMGRTELAMTEVQELLGRAGKDPNVLALAGEAYLANGDLAGAARHFEQAKALAPENAALQTRLAQMRFAAGDQQRGIAELEAASASDPQAYQADLALVANYLRQRQPDKALEALNTLEKKQPDSPLTHSLRGHALTLKGDAAGARASFERAVKLRPNYMPAIGALARLDLAQNKTEAAKRRYEAVLKTDPGNEQALSGLAVLLRVTGADAKQIERLLQQSVTANPASPSARVALINFHLRSRDFKAALAAAQEAQAALPNNAAVVQALGVAQLAAAEMRQAMATFARLGEMLPKSPEPHVLLASAHLAAKQPDEAIKSLRNALALRPDLAKAHRDIAAIYVATGRAEEALREAKSVQAAHPAQPLGYVLEGEIQAAQKNWDSAERLYRDALKKFDLPLLVARLHAVMDAAGKRAEADALAESWIEAHPKDTAVLAYLADRDIAAKRYDRAVKRYGSALERQADNPLLLNNLAWAMSRLKQPKALAYAERAHELAPNNPAIMDTLGWMLSESGQNERGLELLARATNIAPQAHEIRLNFAKSLMKAGRTKAAREELEALAKLDSRLPVQQEAASLLAGK